MNKLYYTIEKEVFSDTQRLTGNKIIRVYEMNDNMIKLFSEIESKNDLNSEKEIQFYLDNNGYENEIIEFEQL